MSGQHGGMLQQEGLSKNQNAGLIVVNIADFISVNLIVSLSTICVRFKICNSNFNHRNLSCVLFYGLTTSEIQFTWLEMSKRGRFLYLPISDP